MRHGIILPSSCNRPCHFNTRRSVRFPINSPAQDACPPEPLSTLIYLLTRCQPPYARCTEVRNGPLPSRPQVFLKRLELSPVVFSDHSGDFSADGNASQCACATVMASPNSQRSQCARAVSTTGSVSPPDDDSEPHNELEPVKRFTTP